MTNLQNGGIEACRTMVTDLAPEAEMAQVVSDGADTMQDEMISSSDGMSAADLLGTVLTVDAASLTSIETQTRHSFAVYLLGILEEAS
jgi:hypothetical protein